MDGRIAEVSEIGKKLGGKDRKELGDTMKTLGTLEQTIRDLFKEKATYSFYKCPGREASPIQKKEICGVPSKTKALMSLPWQMIPSNFSTHGKKVFIIFVTT